MSKFSSYFYDKPEIVDLLEKTFALEDNSTIFEEQKALSLQIKDHLLQMKNSIINEKISDGELYSFLSYFAQYKKDNLQQLLIKHLNGSSFFARIKAAHAFKVDFSKTSNGNYLIEPKVIGNKVNSLKCPMQSFMLFISANKNIFKLADKLKSHEFGRMLWNLVINSSFNENGNLLLSFKSSESSIEYTAKFYIEDGKLLCDIPRKDYIKELFTFIFKNLSFVSISYKNSETFIIEFKQADFIEIQTSNDGIQIKDKIKFLKGEIYNSSLIIETLKQQIVEEENKVSNYEESISILVKAKEILS